MDIALKFSLNVGFYNKYPKDISEGYENKFINFDGTLAHLAQAINLGVAYSYQYYFEERSTKNFLCADILSIDIDKGLTLSDALENTLIKNYCSLLYTTPSHTIDHHRFRLVFILPRTISDSKELKAANKSLARRLGGDMSATDAGRIFYGSSNSNPQILGKAISEEFLNELIDDGLIESSSDSIIYRPTQSRSNLKIKSKEDIKTVDGHNLKIHEFKVKTSVFCPFHFDERASAFVGLNSKLEPFLFCSTCQTTRWSESSQPVNFDFNGFENTIYDYRNNPPNNKIEHLSPITQLTGEETLLESAKIHFTKDRYLNITNVEDGITFVKSPKGSGKTNFLENYLKNVIYKYGAGSLEDFENNSDNEIDETEYSNKRVLLIGHRQALINEMCNRLGLKSYLEVKNLKELKKFNNQNYGVCLDSLCNALGDQSETKWDVIIIDECEQVLSHFLSETIGNKRNEIFNRLNTLISNAKSIIALDADLNWVSFNTITKMANFQSKEIKPIQLYINKWIENQKEIFLYQASSQLINHLHESIIKGKRVFISSNSKTKIQALEKSINDLALKLKIQIPLIAITSENSKTVLTQHFIKNIKSEIKNYSVILSSPSLGTGIDITFENNAEEIDLVYGLYENKINTHFEIDQQLRRVRHPKEVHIWISPVRFNFETEFEIVKEEYLNQNYLLNIYHQQLMTDKLINTSNTLIINFLTMAALVTVNQRASKNKLKKNFIDYKKLDGWEIVEVAQDESEMKAGNAFYKLGKDKLNDEIIEAILNAPPLNNRQYDDIIERMESNTEEVNRKEQFSLLRTNLELFYRCKINRELIVNDKFGGLRRGIKTYENVTDKIIIDSIKLSKNINSHNTNNLNIIESILPNRNSKIILLVKLFEKTSIYRDGKFLSDVVYTANDLENFIIHLIELKPYIENHLGLNIRRDAIKNPVQQLKVLLDQVGLGQIFAKKQVINGKSACTYKLDDVKLNRVMITTLRRKSNDIQWAFFNRLHGFESESYLDVPQSFYKANSKIR